MRLAAGVLAILVAPMLLIAIDPYPQTSLYRVVTFVLGGIGFVLLVVAIALQPRRGPGRTVEERAVIRYMNVFALAAACLIAVGSLVFTTSHLDYAPIICGAAVVWSLIWIPSVMRRIGVDTEVLINREPADVFRFMLDPRNITKYSPDVLSVEKITEGDIGPGTRFLSRVRMGDAGVFEGVEEIVGLEWGRRITDRVAGLRPNIGVMTFEPAGKATRLSYRFTSEIIYAGALLGQGLLRSIVAGKMRAQRNANWMRLKQVLESEPNA